MKKVTFQSWICTILCATIFITTLSCKKDEVPTNQDDCTFVQNDEDMDGIIDDAERELLDNCEANQLTSKSEIETNLIGEWELVGHAEGWLPIISQPCSYMTITEEELILEHKDSYLDTLSTHTWEILESSSGNFYLEFLPNNGLRIHLNTFCNDYMYGDGTSLDSNMYLYQKVN